MWCRTTPIKKIKNDKKNSDGNAKSCLELCVGNFFRAQETVGEYMEKKLGNKCC